MKDQTQSLLKLIETLHNQSALTEQLILDIAINTTLDNENEPLMLAELKTVKL